MDFLSITTLFAKKNKHVLWISLQASAKVLEIQVVASEV